MAVGTQPIWKRHADAVYLAFALVHLLAGVLIDAQVFLPRQYFPNGLSSALDKYMRDSGDPLFLNALSYRTALDGAKPSGGTWFQTALFTELVFQNPAYLVWIWGLIKDDARVYPLILVQATLSLITTLQVLATHVLELAPQYTKEQFDYTVAVNAIWVLVPAVITVDIGSRLSKIAGGAATPRAGLVDKKRQ